MRQKRWPWILGAFGLLVVGLWALERVNPDDGADVTSPTRAALSTTSAGPGTTAAARTTTSAPAVERLPLLEAAAGGLVEAEFRSRGGASGDVVELAVRRLAEAGDVTLELTVPAGLVLANPAEGEQDLVVAGLKGRITGASTYRPASVIRLSDDTLLTYLLEAYCAEAHEGNPSAGGALLPGEVAGADLVAVLQAVEGAGVAGEAQVIQAVVWAITDDVTADELGEVGYGLDAEELALARAIVEAAGLDPAAYRLFSG